MCYIHFQKEQLIDLGFSLEREILLTNRHGAYCSSTLANCNTRKYHGLLITSQPQIDDNRYVLLSSLDESIIRNEKKILLSTHHYPNAIFPQGYQYLENFTYERTPEWTYVIPPFGSEGGTGDIEINKEILMVEEEDRVIIRYTVARADRPFELRLDPVIAFRNIHSLSKANMVANKKTDAANNGITLKLYDAFNPLFLQFSKKADFTPVPDWYYNVEYKREQERGYDYTEDLYSPGYFKFKLKKGESVIFSAGTSEINPRRLIHVFKQELNQRRELHNFKDCLENAAKQFINNNNEITAGYHWFGPWGRDTFISLPGLTLNGKGNAELCKKILDSSLKGLKNGLLPNVGTGENAAYNSADSSLWFIWALQQYFYHNENIQDAWNEYGEPIKSILENYKNGTLYNIHAAENALLYAGEPGVALTWMDAVVDGVPVTPRTGFAVELNALWYNAIRFALECAKHASDETFINTWRTFADQIELSFTETFWDPNRGYLADCVNGSEHDWSLRPNQIIACSLPYPVVSEEIKHSLINVVKNKLLTPRGLRTLSPDDNNYKGTYEGNYQTRDKAYHQGTVWPWLLAHFAKAFLSMDGEKHKEIIQSIYENFGPAIMEYGIGSIAEIYDGDAPFAPKGAVSQAWSVAELLRMRELVINFNHHHIAEAEKAQLTTEKTTMEQLQPEEGQKELATINND